MWFSNGNKTTSVLPLCRNFFRQYLYLIPVFEVEKLRTRIINKLSKFLYKVSSFDIRWIISEKFNIYKVVGGFYEHILS